MGSYRCGCPEGFVQHLYYNQCIDENECNTSPCGDNTCINTIGSYKCGCPDGYQFDGNLQICVQVSFRFQRLIIRDYYFRCEKKNLMYFRWALDASEALAPLVALLTGQMDSSADALPGINELDRFVIDVTLGYFDVTFIYFLPFDFQWSGSLFVHDQSTIARTLWRRHQQCTDVRDKSRSVSYTACGWQDNIDGRLLFLQGDLTIIPDHRVVRRWSQQRKKKLFSVPKVNGKGRHRRYLRTKSMDQELIARRHEIMKRRFVRSAKRHHHGEEYILKISLRQTRHRMRIIKLQPAVKVHFLVY